MGCRKSPSAETIEAGHLKCTKANVQVTHQISLIQMITKKTMSHKCVAQQVVAYVGDLKNKGNDQLVIPTSGRGRSRIPGAVAYV